jgi:hypothetical protein
MTPRPRSRKHKLTTVDCVSAPYALQEAKVKQDVQAVVRRRLVEAVDFAKLCFRAVEAQKTLNAFGASMLAQRVQPDIILHLDMHETLHTSLQHVLRWMQASSTAFPKRSMPPLMPAQHLAYLNQHPDCIKNGNVPTEIKTREDDDYVRPDFYTFTEHEFYCAFEDWWTKDTTFVDMVHEQRPSEDLEAYLQRPKYTFDGTMIWLLHFVLQRHRCPLRHCSVCMHNVLSVVWWMKEHMHSRFLSLLPVQSAWTFGAFKICKRDQEADDSLYNRCVELVDRLSEWDNYILCKHKSLNRGASL